MCSGRSMANWRKGIHTTETDPGPAIERQILPPDFPAHPPFRPELVRILAPEILAPMHDVHGVIDRLALAHEDRTLPVRPAANGDGGIFSRDTGIEGDDWVEAQ